MKTTINLIAILLLCGTLAACAEVPSRRVELYPVPAGVGDIGYVTSGPYPYYVYPGYDLIYHPGYYVIPSRGDNAHYHQK